MPATTTGIPDRVVIRQMDRLRRIAEDAERSHDELAYELGFDRVRVEHIKPGDVIATGNGWERVISNEPWFDGDRRILTANDAEHLFDPGAMVSRKRPDESEELF